MRNFAELDLTGQLLIAMPGMEDPRFERSVVFMCSHSSDGAMGLIINKPTDDLRFYDLLDQMKINYAEGSCGAPVYFGGPVETGRGFVLHSSDYLAGSTTIEVDNSFSMTATQDILEDIAAGEGPVCAMMMLGYAGWEGGQLESELAQNGWLTAPATLDLVFGHSDDDKWTYAMRQLGIDVMVLSAEAGHA